MARKRKKLEEEIMLHCGANSFPGVEWYCEIKLVKKRLGYYQLYQSDFWREKTFSAQLCGNPPWRLISTYLNNMDAAWYIDAQGPEEFGSQGLENWQATAVSISWLREGNGAVNYGLEFRYMTDDEVQKVCKPYADRADWRGSHILSLWNDISVVFFMASENHTIQSNRLKDILTQSASWGSPDPIRAALEWLESHESAEARSH